MTTTFEETARRLLAQLKVRHLRVIVATGELRNGTAVAAQLGVSPAAVSKTLHEVEELLAMSLFDRGRHGMRPTDAGLLMIEQSKLVLVQLERMTEAMVGLGQGVSGSLHLAASTVSAQSLVAATLANFQKRHPSVMVRFTMASTVEEMVEQLTEGELDLAFSYADRRFEKPGLATQLLLPEQNLFIVAAKGHPLTRSRTRLTSAALHDALWCIPSEWSRLRHHLEAMFREEGLDMPQRGFVSSDLPMILNLMRTARCLTIMPERVARQVARDGLGVVLRFDVAGRAERVDMIWYDKIRPRATASLFKRAVLQRTAQTGT